ncbi:MAG: hypothetical protein ACOCRK_10640 [bacterium]
MSEKDFHYNTRLLSRKEAKEVVDKLTQIFKENRFKDFFDFKYYVKIDGKSKIAVDIYKFIEKKIDAFIFKEDIFTPETYNREFFRKRTKIIINQFDTSDTKREKKVAKEILNCYYTDERDVIKQEVYFELIKYLSQGSNFKSECGYYKQINAFLNYIKVNIYGGITRYLDKYYKYKIKQRIKEEKIMEENIDKDTSQNSGDSNRMDNDEDKEGLTKMLYVISLDDYLKTGSESGFFDPMTDAKNIYSAEQKVCEDDQKNDIWQITNKFLEKIDSKTDRDIYRQYRINGTKNQTQLAEKYGITQQAVSKKITKYDKMLRRVFEDRNISIRSVA